MVLQNAKHFAKPPAVVCKFKDKILMNKLRLLTLIIVTIFLTSCGEGYEKVDNEWAWVLRSEAGKHVTKLNADEATFEILSDKKYAKDKESVFWKGVKIDLADPFTFEVISSGYSKDDKHVFLDNDIVVFANPEKFEILEWPFSKDDRYIFNGNIPLTSKNIEEFVITKSTGKKTASTKSFFIEWNKDFKWLDTINVNGIIIRDDSEGHTREEKFKGVRKIE
jgi:hypothetical protein